ncbi:MAG: efflux RND transporter periplasmic adaptor subunit [Treponema sp.]|jgi:multidrug efflux pump subunit AcrA (membrane-fusion protein)|nr:efflux RND transporter periplasmic adaptor subunit [Treponema sp.]
MKNKIIIIAAALSAAAVLLASCFNAENKNTPAGAADAGAAAVMEKPVFAVNTTAAVQGQISDYLALSGDIISGSTVDVYSDVAGKVTRLYVSVGSRVSRNQAIAAVDPSKPGMTYVPGIARAPIAGTVVALPAQIGMTVAQSVPLARIAAGGALETRVYVAERFISKIALNQSCEILLDAYPGEAFKGSVAEISPTVDPTSRTMEVKINVSDSGSRLKAGMFAKVRIITEKKDNIVKIPATALVSRFGEDYVFTTTTDPEDPAFLIAKKTIVKPGILVDNALEIQEGLAPGQEIVVKGQSMLNDGSRVNVVEHVQPLESGE